MMHIVVFFNVFCFEAAEDNSCQFIDQWCQWSILTAGRKAEFHHSLWLFHLWPQPASLTVCVGVLSSYWPGMCQPCQLQLPGSCWSLVQTCWWPWPGPGWSPWMPGPPRWLTGWDQPPPRWAEPEPPGSSFHWMGTTEGGGEQWKLYIKGVQYLHSQC